MISRQHVTAYTVTIAMTSVWNACASDQAEQKKIVRKLIGCVRAWPLITILYILQQSFEISLSMIFVQVVLHVSSHSSQFLRSHGQHNEQRNHRLNLETIDRSDCRITVNDQIGGNPEKANSDRLRHTFRNAIIAPDKLWANRRQP